LPHKLFMPNTTPPHPERSRNSTNTRRNHLAGTAPNMTDLVLAGDLGAGSLRIGAVTGGRGELVAEAAVAVAATEPKPGWSEIDPEIWWRALRRGGRSDASTGLRPDQRVVGVCLSRPDPPAKVLLDPRTARSLRPGPAVSATAAPAADCRRQSPAIFASDKPRRCDPRPSIRSPRPGLARTVRAGRLRARLRPRRRAEGLPQFSA